MDPPLKLAMNLFPTQLRICSEWVKRAFPDDKRTMVAIIASYIIESLKDTTQPNELLLP